MTVFGLMKSDRASHVLSSLSAILSVAVLSSAFAVGNAGAEPANLYLNVGVENSVEYVFTAEAEGDVIAYFYAGAAASLTNALRMRVNGTDTLIQGLENHSTPFGAALNFGAVSAGDVLVFEMVNLNPEPVGPWFSDMDLNSDGVNHVFSTEYHSGLATSSVIPTGTYVGFEDLPQGGDFNYFDATFVFANVETTIRNRVPEPATPLLIAAGLLGFALFRKVRHS